MAKEKKRHSHAGAGPIDVTRTIKFQCPGGCGTHILITLDPEKVQREYYYESDGMIEPASPEDKE